MVDPGEVGSWFVQSLIIFHYFILACLTDASTLPGEVDDNEAGDEQQSKWTEICISWCM